MVTIVLSLFVLAAILGLAIAIPIFKKKQTSKPVVYAHGAAGALGLVLLVVYTFQSSHNLLIASVVLFVVAALGGFVLFANDLRGKPGPVPLILIHAALAVAGLTLVLLAIT